jgi:hypothetical protein
MASEKPVIEGQAVSWRLDSPQLTLPRLGELLQDMMSLLREVQSDIIRNGGVQWVVESISKSSPLSLSVVPIAERSRVPKRSLNQVSQSVTRGLKQIQKRPVRPAHFSDEALERAAKIITFARNQDARLQVDSQILDSQFLANVEQILGQQVREIGTIEGRLEAINVHRNRFFNVYDPLTARSIRCDFGQRIGSTVIGEALEQRVAVYGEIVYRESGEIVRIIAQSIEVFPPEEELPTADDVLGILA